MSEARFVPLVFLSVCCLLIGGSASAQRDDKDWRRVMTGADFTVDVDASSLVFEPGRILSATYRTVLSKSEALPGDPAAKYKTRLDIIQFRTKDSRYRYSATSFLDSKGKVMNVGPAPAGNWKPLRGSAGTMFGALLGLRPFGSWTVNSYRFVENIPKPELDSTEFAKLVGSNISLTVDYARAGTKNCPYPAYESKQLTDNDLEKHLRASLKPLGLKANPMQVIALKCEAKEWQPGQSLLIQVAPDRMLMLWDGVFLELIDKRPKQFSIPITIDPERRIKVSPGG